MSYYDDKGTSSTTMVLWFVAIVSVAIILKVMHDLSYYGV